uniref:Venom polypeptide n=1 Tax=Dolopus genitalis TaxID=2488630 RepID=A0A3G5BIF8_DOLGE|nr:venom polypeptide [Dolopus genitalis]
MKLTIGFLLLVVVLQCMTTPAESKSLQKKASEVFNKAVNKIKEAVNKLKTEAKAFFQKAKEGIKKGLSAMKEKLKTLPDKAMRAVFQGLHDAIEKARKKLKETNEVADEKFYKAMKKAHDKFFDVTSQIEKFVTKQKEAITKKQEKEKATEILDDFVIRSSEKIESCSDAALGPVKDLYERTKAVINGSVDKMENILKASRECMDAVSKIVKCAPEIARNAKKQLSDLGNELLELKSKLLGVAMNEVTNFICIGRTRTDVELDKMSVKSRIDDIK